MNTTDTDSASTTFVLKDIRYVTDSNYSPWGDGYLRDLSGKLELKDYWRQFNVYIGLANGKSIQKVQVKQSAYTSGLLEMYADHMRHGFRTQAHIWPFDKNANKPQETRPTVQMWDATPTGGEMVQISVPEREGCLCITFMLSLDMISASFTNSYSAVVTVTDEDDSIYYFTPVHDLKGITFDALYNLNISSQESLRKIITPDNQTPDKPVQEGFTNGLYLKEMASQRCLYSGSRLYTALLPDDAWEWQLKDPNGYNMLPTTEFQLTGMPQSESGEITVYPKYKEDNKEIILVPDGEGYAASVSYLPVWSSKWGPGIFIKLHGYIWNGGIGNGWDMYRGLMCDGAGVTVNTSPKMTDMILWQISDTPGNEG